jgi:hypothetical protein
MALGPFRRCRSAGPGFKQLDPLYWSLADSPEPDSDRFGVEMSEK